MIGLKELKAKILEALIFALPITCIVYFMSLLPWFDFTSTELITFSVGAVFLVLDIGLFHLGADPCGNESRINEYVGEHSICSRRYRTNSTTGGYRIRPYKNIPTKFAVKSAKNR